MPEDQFQGDKAAMLQDQLTMSKDRVVGKAPRAFRLPGPRELWRGNVEEHPQH